MLVDISHKQRVLQWIILSVVIGGTLYLYYTPFHFKFSELMGYIYDGLHFPGGVGLGLLLAAFGIPRQLSLKHFIYSLIFLAGITALLEILQPLSGRNAGFQDWLVGYLGCCVGLLLNVCLRSRRWLSLLFVALVVAVTTMFFNFKTAIMLKGYQIADERLPVITNFENTWIDRYMWRPKGWTDEWKFQRPAIDVVNEWKSEGLHSLRVSTLKGRMMGIRYPLNDQNWEDYQFVKFDIYNPNEAFDLVFRLYDHKSTFKNKQRFWRDLSIQPGLNEISIALNDIRHQSGERVLDLSKVKHIELFIDYVAIPNVFYVDNVKLE